MPLWLALHPWADATLVIYGIVALVTGILSFWTDLTWVGKLLASVLWPATWGAVILAIVAAKGDKV